MQQATTPINKLQGDYYGGESFRRSRAIPGRLIEVSKVIE
jgi:hypothetical protein